jgi:hypothetical protein
MWAPFSLYFYNESDDNFICRKSELVIWIRNCSVVLYSVGCSKHPSLCYLSFAIFFIPCRSFKIVLFSPVGCPPFTFDVYCCTLLPSTFLWKVYAAALCRPLLISAAFHSVCGKSLLIASFTDSHLSRRAKCTCSMIYFLFRHLL